MCFQLKGIPLSPTYIWTENHAEFQNYKLIYYQKKRKPQQEQTEITIFKSIKSGHFLEAKMKDVDW